MQEKLVKRAFKYRFYPTPEQESLLNQTFGCVRVVWNKALEARSTAWTQNQERVSYTDTSAMLTQWKKAEEYSWLSDVSSVPLQQTLRHLQAAYQGFFAKRTGYPKFKSRRNRQSAEFTKSGFTYRGGNLYLAKSKGPLNIRWSRPLPEDAEPTTITVSKDKAGRFFVSILTETLIQQLPKSDEAVGIDLGLTHFATLSDGRKIQNPRVGRKYAAKLARAQKELTRRQKGSKNREKSRIKVARIHNKISDARTDFLHKTSTQLIRENQTVVVEGLAVKNMAAKGGSRKRGLNRSISDASWSAFIGMLAYKAEWYGRELVVLDQWYPSTQLCSDCGARTGPRQNLSIRDWKCSQCGVSHDRDVNAAKNILAAGTAVTVCGDGRSLRHRHDVGAPVREAESLRA